MHPLFALSVFLASAHSSLTGKSSGCGQPTPFGLTQGGTGRSNALTFGTMDGTQRQYLLHIPENYDSNTPAGLILAYAGRGESAENHESTTQLSESSYNPNDIVLYPKAYTPENSGMSRTRLSMGKRVQTDVQRRRPSEKRKERSN